MRLHVALLAEDLVKLQSNVTGLSKSLSLQARILSLIFINVPNMAA